MKYMVIVCAAAAFVAGCASGPKTENTPVAACEPDCKRVECPEIGSDRFSLSIGDLEKSLGEVKISDGAPDAAAVRDAVKSAIEETGRFGKEVDVDKRDGGLSMDVRIVEQKWHSDGRSSRSTLFLEIKVEVTTYLPLNCFLGQDQCLGRGSERLYVSWGTASCKPIVAREYLDGIASAVRKALRDLHPCPNRNVKYFKRITDIETDIEAPPIEWKELGDFSDPKTLEERYGRMYSGQILSPSGKPVAAFDVYDKMRGIILPSVSLRPPATLMDAMLFFQSCAIPLDGSGEAVLFAVFPAKEGDAYPVVPEFSANNISLLDALKRVTESVGAHIDFRCDGVVSVSPKARSVREMVEGRPWSKAETRTSSTER